VACLEPNPHAQDAGNEPGDGDTTGEPSCAPECNLGFELLEFSIQGGSPFTAQIPKPPQAHTVPIAAIHRYAPGQSNELGYAVAWTDNGSSYGLEITITGSHPNSRLAGIAVVLGLGSDFPAPEVHELEVTTEQGCAQISTAALAGRAWFDLVQRYDAGGAAVFDYSRTATVGDAATVEYCVSSPEEIDGEVDGAIAVKLIAFDVPEGASVIPVEATIDSGASAGDSFGELGSVAKIAHLLGGRAFSEASQPSLGYLIDCATQAPYACSYEITNFSAGAAIDVGGVVLAIE
jgi:hypothetical protein